MKLVLNLMIAVTSGMLAEALALGQRGGLSWNDLWDGIVESALGAPIVKAKAPALRARDYTPTFTVQQMRKDLGLILGAGEQLGVALPLAALVQKAMVAAAEQGDVELDYAAVIRVAERAAGLL
ncbi:MAG TPA: NAD-binding protein [Burkholderiaceae bacterium]|nr:NAD-binding protein [Burkholderiaceae bacterium]